MRASNPSHSCLEEAPNTPAKSTLEEQHHVPSEPSKREGEWKAKKTDLPESTRHVQRTLTGTNISETECHCGKKCKNLRGLRIHQAKARCQPMATQQQHSASYPSCWDTGGSKSEDTPQYWGPLRSCTVTGRSYAFIGGGDKLARDPKENGQEEEDQMTCHAW